MSLNKKEDSKQNKTKAKKKGFLYYLNIKNLKKEVESKGYKLDSKKCLIILGIAILITVLVGWVMNMAWYFIIGLAIIDCLGAPSIIIATYEKKYQEQRFFDASDYMDGILSVFLRTKSIPQSLHEMKEKFDEGQMKTTLEKAAHYVETEFSENQDVEATALSIIEEQYPSPKITTVHNFLLRQKDIGGDIEHTVTVLQTDRRDWEERGIKSQDERKNARLFVGASIVISMLLSFFMERVLCMTAGSDDMLTALDISRNIAVQISTLIMWTLMLMVYISATKRLAIDLLTEKEKYTDEQKLKMYERFENWDAKKEFLTSIKYSIVVVVIASVLLGVYFALDNSVLKIVSLCLYALAIPLLFQHRLDYNLLKKRIIKEIEIAYPSWIVEIALLLQVENVQTAIYDSFENAPVILKP